MSDKNETLYNMLSFPVLWIGKIYAITFVDLEHLRTCDSIYLRDREKPGVLIDKTLAVYEIKKAGATGYVNPFWGFRLPGTRVLLVDYQFSDARRQITLDEIKAMIIKVSKTSGMYRDMAGNPRGYEASIRRLKTFDEILQRFQIGPKRGWTRLFWAGPLD